jgi:mannose/fructose-specific phosphotransferase system component IIA
LIKVINLVSLLILPAVISLRHNDMRFVIAGLALLVLIVAILFSKRGGATLAAEEVEEEVAAAAAS